MPLFERVCQGKTNQFMGPSFNLYVACNLNFLLSYLIPSMLNVALTFQFHFHQFDCHRSTQLCFLDTFQVIQLSMMAY